MFHELLNAEKFVDVTLACEHNSLKCHKVRNASCGCYIVARLTFSLILGGAVSMFIIFPKASNRESVQASDHHHAAGSCICRSPVHHRVCLSRRDRRIRSRVAGEKITHFPLHKRNSSSHRALDLENDGDRRESRLKIICENAAEAIIHVWMKREVKLRFFHFHTLLSFFEIAKT